MPNFGKTTIRNRLHLLKTVFDEAEEIVVGYQVFNLAKLDSNRIIFGDLNDTSTELVGGDIILTANKSITLTAQDFILNGNLTVNGNTTIGNSDNTRELVVYGDTTLNGILTMNDNIYIGSNTLYVDNGTTLGIKYGTKNIDGIGNSNGLLIGDVTPYGNGSFTIIGNDCKMAYSLYVKDSTTLNKGLTINNAGLELYSNTPYIDFHFNNSTADYTSRIIESESGVLEINKEGDSVGYLKSTFITASYGTDDPSGTGKIGQLYFKYYN